MGRFEDWEKRFVDIGIERSVSVHEWGVHDCVIFGADAVLAMTGDDVASDVRGQYDGPISAARIIKKNGFDSLGDMIAARLPEIDVALAQRGDAVLCDGEDGEFVAIVNGHTCVGPSRFGLVHVPIKSATRAFKVG